MVAVDLLAVNDSGLYCAAGDFYIDPWRPVDRAVITHAHGDHARYGCRHYLAARDGHAVLRTRLGDQANIQTIPFGVTQTIRDVKVSLHPAGHILGSAQVRVEHAGEIWVASGDYKIAPDPTCTAFEPVRCHTFITESTFGLPIYRWRPDAEVMAEINAWWADNASHNIASVIYAYSLGKAQRVLSGLDSQIGPIFCHGSVQRLNADYRNSGVSLPETMGVRSTAPADYERALIVAPPSARGTPWLRRFGDFATAFVSGWMQVRGARRRRAVDRGFVLSDHADWPGLNEAITATGASRVLVTHGSIGSMVRWLNERGFQAAALQTHFEGEQDEVSDTTQGDADEDSEASKP